MCSEVSANFKDIPLNKRFELFQCPVQAPNVNTGGFYIYFYWILKRKLIFGKERHHLSVLEIYLLKDFGF